MEQLVARRAHNPKVVGSSPAPATNKSRLILSGFFYLIEFRFCENWVQIWNPEEVGQQVVKKK